MSDASGSTIGFGRALIEQLRWFWQRLRVWVIVVPVILAIAAVGIVRAIGTEEPPGAYLALTVAFHPLFVIIALSWALSAWRDDPPKDRQYFWLHPVERTTHTIVRALAGFLWLMLALVIVLATFYVVTRSLIPADRADDAMRIWLYSIGGIVIAYLAASIAAMLSDRPVIWILVVIGIVLIAASLAEFPQLAWLRPIVGVLIGEPLSFGSAVGAPGVEVARLAAASLPPGETLQGTPLQNAAAGRPATALLIWLPVTLVAFLAAARLSRPR